MIKPTVGRVVWIFKRVHPDENDQPECALVCYVHNDTTINVAGFDRDGHPFKAWSLTLLQDDEPEPDHVHAQWMPFQKGQAAALEKAAR